MRLVAAIYCIGYVAGFFFSKKKSNEKEAVVENAVKVRGVSPSDSEKYVWGNEFTCDNGKTKLPFGSVNDNYCDCLDGTDEPGTSACAKSVFRCVNKGYKVTTIPSSRVDDGICDCCDGSDEGVETAACPNVCDRYASKQREMMEKVVNAYKTGNAIRLNYIDAASKAYGDASNSVSSLASEITVIQQQIDTHKTIVAHEELMEHTEKLEQMQVVKNKVDALLSIHQISVTHLGHIISSLIDVFNIQDINKYVDPIQESSSSSHVEGQAVIAPEHAHLEFLTKLNPAEVMNCQQLTGDFTLENLFPLCSHEYPDGSNQHPILETAKVFLKEIIGIHKGYKEIQFAFLGKLLGVGIPPITVAEVDAHGDGMAVRPKFQKELLVQYIQHKMGLTLAECNGEFPSEKSLCELHQELELVYSPHGYGSHFKYERLESAHTRATLRELEQKLSQIQDAKEDAVKSVNQFNTYNNYLPYLALKKECFKVTEANKFDYNLCMFDSVTQKEVHGHNTVTLGTFHTFSENKDGQVVMHFTDGTHCHAHGARKADITVVCGVSNVLKEAREPATCHYTLELESPAACNLKFAEQQGITNLV